jgi:D-3-phosphoglycerate dehydrogenase / 2-oxoglutarate reductase
VSPGENRGSAESAAGRRPRVVFSDPTIRREALDLLTPSCDVRVLESYASETVLAKACIDADAILARLGTVSAAVIDAAPRLRIIARHGVGVDTVDLAAATRRGIVVTTTGSENAAAVAEYTFALLFALVRKIVAADSSMREGQWSREPLVGMELEGRTLGIVGYGAIGRRVARQAAGFGMRVLAFDPAVGDTQDANVALTTLDDLLEQSDVVSLHTRLTAETAHQIGARALARMKRGAVLINTARGEIVDESALIQALSSGALGGAALDTYEHEPLPTDSPLRRLPNVVLSPHVAGQTDAALVRVAVTAAQAILDEFAGQRPKHVYNPEVYDMRAARKSAMRQA